MVLYISVGIAAAAISALLDLNKEHLMIALVLGATTSIIYRNRRRIWGGEEDTRDFVRDSWGISKNTLRCAYVILITLDAWVCIRATGSYHLPIEHFALASSCAVLIFLQIASLRNENRLDTLSIIAQIMTLSFIISASVIFMFPGPYGNDSPVHLEIIENIVDTGHIDATSHYGEYPLFHLLFALVSQASNSAEKICQLGMGIVQLSFSLFVFSITRRLFNVRAGLFAMMFITLAPYLAQPKFTYFPGAFAAIFFILSIYAIHMSSEKLTSSVIVLAIVAYTVVVFTHPLAPVILMTAAIIITVASRSLKMDKTPVSYFGVLYVGLLTLFLWSAPWKDGSVLSNITTSISNALRNFDQTSIEQATVASHYDRLDIIFIDFGFTVLLFLGAAGSFCFMKSAFAANQRKQSVRKTELRKSSLAITALLMIPIPFVLTVLYPLSLPARWYPYVEVFLCVFGGLAMLVIIRSTLFNKPGVKGVFSKIAIGTLTFVLVFFMISSPTANPNNQLYSTAITGRSALTQSEEMAAEFLNGINASHLSANSKYIFLEMSEYLDPSDNQTYEFGVAVVRDYDIDKGFTIPLFGSEGRLFKIIAPNQEFCDFMNDSNRFYDIGAVYAFVS